MSGYGIGMSSPRVPVSLSTVSCYPQGCKASFRYAADLGYDGLEVMVWGDPATRDASRLVGWSREFGVPVRSIHAPTLLLTQLVWGPDPWVKVEKSAQLAVDSGCETVVVHPPFMWQRGYARKFQDGVARIAAKYGVKIAVENMFPWRAGDRVVEGYIPGWDPRDYDYDFVTLDMSHTATSGSDAFQMAVELGEKLHHIHLADGMGSARDEHLLPGRGTQRCADVLSHVASCGHVGDVVVEVNTRGLPRGVTRGSELAEALAFARDHLGQA